MRNIHLWPRLVLAALVAAALPLAAQTNPTGKIHGQVTDPTGAALGSGTISLYEGGMASPTAAAKYTLNVDESGSFKGDNIAPGGYTMVYRKPDTPKDKVVDQIDNVKIVAGQDTEANDDMSRQEYVDKLSPDQKKQIEEIKNKNASINKENQQIKNLNGDLEKARSDDKDKNYADAISLMQHDVSLKPDEPLLWVELGQSQLGNKQYSDAETSLNKGITLETAAKKPNPQVIGSAGNALGEAFADDNKIPDSQAAYDAAAKAYPTDAGMYYQNETIVLSRTGQADAVVAAADKAVAADPTRPIPYYLKGQALIGKATMDPKTQKIVAPPGCQEAYEKYLQLAPTGQFANDAKQVLAEMSGTSGKKH